MLSVLFSPNSVLTPSNPLYKPTKQIATVRLDSDVLLWLKSQGKGYQTRMNAILRQAMLTELAETH